MRVNRIPKKRLFVVCIASVLLALAGYRIVHSVVQRNFDWKRWVGWTDRPTCKNCNVILITLDTLSANHLPCYGYLRNTAPNLCAFAANNILFKNSYANASWTLPSDVSMLTSLYPQYHGITDDMNYMLRLSSRIPTLPDILQQHGYRTYFGIPNDRAFPVSDVYYQGITRVIPVGSGAQENLDGALGQFLRDAADGHRTFLYLHSYYVRNPYLIENRKKMFTSDTFPNIPLSRSQVYDNFSEDFYQNLIEELARIVGKPNSPIDPSFYEKLKSAPTLSEAKKLAESKIIDLDSYYNEYYYLSRINIRDPRQVEYIKALYDQKIFELDEWIGNVLLPFLNNPVIKKNTIVIITSEHGEEFMEHGRITHETLYDSNVKVPLIISLPGASRKTVDVPVQTVDITPTVLDVLGISLRPFRFQGVSLLGSITGSSMRDRLLIANSYNGEHDLKTVRNMRWKMFMIRDNGTYIPYELYDIMRDPTESANLLTSHWDVVKRLVHQIDLYERKWQSLMAGR